MRVWDYHAQISIAMYQAANPVMCVSLHPWGTDIIISFYESAFTYVVGGNELIKGQRLAESASGKVLPALFHSFQPNAVHPLHSLSSLHSSCSVVVDSQIACSSQHV